MTTRWTTTNAREHGSVLFQLAVAQGKTLDRALAMVARWIALEEGLTYHMAGAMLRGAVAECEWQMAKGK